jgi:hypothetical protein
MPVSHQQNRPLDHTDALKTQSCQIFLGTILQNGKNIPKCPQNIPDGHKTYEMAVK